MKTSFKINLLLFVGILVFLFPANARAQGPDRPPSVSQAQPLWIENCTPCHGPSGLGDGPTAQAIENPLPNFADPIHARQMTPAAIHDTIKNGRIETLMPPWKNQLSDAEMWDLTAQVWRLGVNSEDLVAGETLYAGQCAACHGESGRGDGPEASATINDFTDLGRMVQLSQADLQINYEASADHSDLTLSEIEVWQTLDYARTFSFIVPQRNGLLSGQVINQTTNEPAANVELTLLILSSNSIVESLTAQSDEAGRYTFAKLPTDPGFLFVLEGAYQGIIYETEPSHGFSGDNNEANLNLDVYEATTSAEAINVTQLHYIVGASAEVVNVLQIFVIGNQDNQTYIGDEAGRTFSFALPDNAQNPIFQGDSSGTRFVETGQGFVDTAPILPGEEGSMIAVSYDIPYNEDTLTVETPLPADVAALNLMLGAPEVEFSSEQLDFAGTRDIQGSVFSMYDGSDLRQGETLAFKFSNLEAVAPATAPASTITSSAVVDQGLLRWVIIGLGGLAIVGGGIVYPLMRSQSAGPAGAEDQDPEFQRRKLLLTLARLDEIFEAGELDETIYREARVRYIARLAALMR